MSEIITDLANDILSCPDWNHEEVHSPHTNLIQDPDIQPNDIPFGQALAADVIVPPVKHGVVESYIDDLIPVTLHDKHNSPRVANVVPLAMHILGRPVDANEPISRDDLLCFRKLLGEGQLSEVKIVTGWGIDTRRFIIFLTDEKTITWNK